MRKLLLLAFITTASIAWSAAIPAQITYQGTVKQQGIPVNNVTKNMFFRITNQDGTQVYWSSGNMSVPVSNGLFSVQLAPTGVDWQNVTPYIEVSIEGQVLLPREPVAATVYAQMSQSIVDGAVTQSKLDPIVAGALIPSGMIAMFNTSCPSGWTRFSALDNNFPMGGPTYGVTGGSTQHSHSLAIISTGGGNGGLAIGTTHGASNNGLAAIGGAGSLPIDFRSADTDSQSNLPPYLSLVFCKKN